jgi:hypothetical protein
LPLTWVMVNRRNFMNYPAASIPHRRSYWKLESTTMSGSSPSPGPGCLHGRFPGLDCFGDHCHLLKRVHHLGQNDFDNCNFFTQSAANRRLPLTWAMIIKPK